MARRDRRSEPARAALRGVDAIIHAGDVGSPEVLEGLREIAAVTAVRGNNDRGAWARTLPERAMLEIAGRRILVIHEIGKLQFDFGADVVVSGHSHRSSVTERDGILFVNPGSAGPRRFSLPVSLAYLRVGKRTLETEIVVLER